MVTLSLIFHFMKRQSTQPAPKLPEIGDDEKTLIRDSGVHRKEEILYEEEEDTHIVDMTKLIPELDAAIDSNRQRCAMILPPKSEVPTHWRDQGNDQ